MDESRAQTVLRLARRILVLYLVAAALAAVATVVLTRDAETGVAGALFSVFLLPSISGIVLVEEWRPKGALKSLAFIIPLAVVELWLWLEVLADSGQASSDGSGELAGLLAFVLLVAGFAAFAASRLLRPGR
jgi:hypothetical protein